MVGLQEYRDCLCCENKIYADVAQLVECVLGKDEVSGSIPDIGSIRGNVGKFDFVEFTHISVILNFNDKRGNADENCGA